MRKLKSVSLRKPHSHLYQNRDQRCEARWTVTPGMRVILKQSPWIRRTKSRTVNTAAIIDINTRGMRLRYTPNGDAFDPFDHLSILDPDGQTIVEDIPCNVISDVPIALFLSMKFDRVCGVKFGHLSYLNKKRLDGYIQEYAIPAEAISSWHVEYS